MHAKREYIEKIILLKSHKVCYVYTLAMYEGFDRFDLPILNLGTTSSSSMNFQSFLDYSLPSIVFPTNSIAPALSGNLAAVFVFVAKLCKTRAATFICGSCDRDRRCGLQSHQEGNTENCSVK